MNCRCRDWDTGGVQSRAGDPGVCGAGGSPREEARLGLGSLRFPSQPTEESLACLAEHRPVDFLGSESLSCGHLQTLMTSLGAAPPGDKPSAF